MNNIDIWWEFRFIKEDIQYLSSLKLTFNIELKILYSLFYPNISNFVLTKLVFKLDKTSVTPNGLFKTEHKTLG